MIFLILFYSELIKNKTLVFLSKALPYLKDNPKIPKVTKIGVNKPVPQPFNSHNAYDFRRKVYGPHRAKRDTKSAKNNETATYSPETIKAIAEIFDNETTARQNCDQGGAAGL